MSKISLAETPFNIHLNNYQSDVSDPNDTPACRHFSQSNHDFNAHAKIHANLKDKKRKQANRSYSGYSKKTQKLGLFVKHFEPSWSKSRIEPVTVASQTYILHVHKIFFHSMQDGKTTPSKRKPL